MNSDWAVLVFGIDLEWHVSFFHDFYVSWVSGDQGITLVIDTSHYVR